MIQKHVCLFAHHDPTGRVAPHVLHYLRELRGCGLVIHLALSGHRALDPRDEGPLAALDVVVHPRENRGLDFGAWAELVHRGCTEAADSVLLANDSVFGPLRPLAPILQTMHHDAPDVWGMVESRECCWHLQSWFLRFTGDAFRSAAIARVLEQPFGEMGKPEIVLHGELGMGAAIRSSGLRWAARAAAPRQGLRRLVPGNPMHLDFLGLARSGRVPFVKIDLLRDNPAAIGWVGEWRDLATDSAAFDAAWVDRHLSGGGRHQPPEPGQSPQMRLLYAALSRDRAAAMRSAIRRRA